MSHVIIQSETDTGLDFGHRHHVLDLYGFCVTIPFWNITTIHIPERKRVSSGECLAFMYVYGW